MSTDTIEIAAVQPNTVPLPRIGGAQVCYWCHISLRAVDVPPIPYTPTGERTAKLFHPTCAAAQRNRDHGPFPRPVSSTRPGTSDPR